MPGLNTKASISPHMEMMPKNASRMDPINTKIKAVVLKYDFSIVMSISLYFLFSTICIIEPKLLKECVIFENLMT